MFSQSHDEFDLWFKHRLAEAGGLDVNTPPTAPPPELLSSYSADARHRRTAEGRPFPNQSRGSHESNLADTAEIARYEGETAMMTATPAQAGIPAASGCALLVVDAARPAVAVTGTVPHDGPGVPSVPVPAQTRTLVIGGMPGGQLPRGGGLQ